jgi:cell division protein FtsI/penicillin-binding protein 2
MSGRTDRRWRTLALIVVFTLLAGGTALRLGQWQVVEAQSLRARAERAMPRASASDTIRADILDRAGTALAQTNFRDRLVAYPDLLEPGEADAILDELAVALDITPAEARVRYGPQLADSAKQYVILEQAVTPAQSLTVAEARASGRLPAVDLEPTQVRVYPIVGAEPDTSLANQLLGFVDAEGRGTYGVEQALDDRLVGLVPPSQQVVASVAGSDALGTTGDAGPPPIRLTLDADLQIQLETELLAARNADDAKSVSAIVMDADSGAILAWATVPGYDANRFREVASQGLDKLRDPIASDTYAPGSVMKALTVAAALARGAVTPKTRVADTPKLPFEGATVQNADHRGMGNISVTQAIAYSRNVATARIAAKLGSSVPRASARLYDMWRLLGIGEPSGIEIASEGSGIVPDPAEEAWAPVDLANNAFGQGVNVTLVQLARAFAALVNGGYLVTPHVSMESAAEVDTPPRVLEAKVARQTREILEYVTGAVPWYAEGSLIPHYQVGGKTGTAQIWDSDKGRYKARAFNFSFVGFIGADEPELVIAVRLAETRPNIRGQGELELNVTSYELFRRIAKMSVRQLGIKPSKDPDVGYPIPLSPADRLLTPRRYQQHLRDRALGRTKTDRPGGDRGDTRGAASDRHAREDGPSDRARDARPATDDVAR